jgi:hypothetical protein
MMISAGQLHQNNSAGMKNDWLMEFGIWIQRRLFFIPGSSSFLLAALVLSFPDASVKLPCHWKVSSGQGRRKENVCIHPNLKYWGYKSAVIGCSRELFRGK